MYFIKTSVETNESLTPKLFSTLLGTQEAFTQTGIIATVIITLYPGMNLSHSHVKFLHIH